jgi:hypothetical protein
VIDSDRWQDDAVPVLAGQLQRRADAMQEQPPEARGKEL